MTRDEVIRLAREAGFHEWYTQVEKHPEHVAIVERFAALVAAQEREACAKTCEQWGANVRVDGWNMAAEDCAAAIRSRSKE